MLGGFSAKYNALGVSEFYRHVGNSYSNPHASTIQKIIRAHCLGHETYLDLACGGGEVTQAFDSRTRITGLDPYLFDLYRKNTGKVCLTQDFVSVAEQGLQGNWDAVICSYALHLVPASLLFKVLWRLSEVSNHLYVISPTKQPIFENCCWELKKQFSYEKVHFRAFKNTIRSPQ